MSKERWITQGNLAHRMLGSPPMPSQAFVFRHRPVRTDCFRPERHLPGGTRAHRKTVPSHGAREK